MNTTLQILRAERRTLRAENKRLKRLIKELARMLAIWIKTAVRMGIVEPGPVTIELLERVKKVINPNA